MELFNEYGHYTGPAFPADCIADCSHSGECSSDIEYWAEELGFEVPRAQAVKWLREFGAWSQEELSEKTDTELAELVLWLACCDLKESGEWFGLCH